jgi:hypothetical protein
VNLFEIAYLSEKQVSSFQSDFRFVAEYFVATRKKKEGAEPTFTIGLEHLKHVEEFIELMRATSRDLDSYYTNQTKTYNYNHSSAGYSVVQMNLNDYRGKMGRLIDAGALLRAIDGTAPGSNGKPAGSAMRVPNVTVSPGDVKELDLAKFFVAGETLTYSVEGGNAAVATVKVEGTKLVVAGVATGATTATVKTGSTTQTIAITVRKVGGNGWM